MSTPNDPKDPEILDPIDDLMLTDGEGEQHERERVSSSVREMASRIPESLASIGRDISRTVERALSAKDDYVVAVKLSHDAQDKLEQLVQAGVFRSRAEAAAFPHLCVHMMSEVSENDPIPGHFQYIFNNGGTMNGTTSSERTNYFETLPANQLPLALWLESDRMRSLKVTQENLDNQRDAVKEEKRLNYDNRPYSSAFLRLNELIYRNPANAHSTIGSMEDLDDATIDDVREFFRIYYAPN